MTGKSKPPVLGDGNSHARGLSRRQWIERMLKPDEYREGIPPALAAGLYLMKVDYEGIEFVDEKYSRDRAYQRMLHSFEWQYTMAAVYGEFKDAMK